MRFCFLLLLFFLVTTTFGQNKNPDDVFYKYETKSINTSELHNLAKSRSSDKVYLTIDRWNVELENSNIISSNYKSFDQDGQILNSKDKLPIPMKGLTDKGGVVSLTIGDGFLYGFIQEGKELYYIEPASYYNELRNNDQVIIYNTIDIKPSAPIACGFIEEKKKEAKTIDDHEQTSRAGLCYDVEYAIVNDWSMVSKYGVSGVEARNIGITNNVQNNYSSGLSDEVRLIITGQYNSTCSNCNPFTVNASDFGVTLTNFANWANGEINNINSSNYIPYDVASFWSDLFPNSGTVGLAWVGAICTSYKYNVLSDLSSNASTLRVLTAHELGHNFGAGHDAANSGYIMAPSVNNTNAWSSASVSSINSHVASRTCLSICADYPAIVYFSQGVSSMIEASSEGTGGPCLEGYTDVAIQVSISKSPTDNVVVSLNTSGSTASASYDYQLMTSSLTFTPGGSLTSDVNVRVYDDAIIEDPEQIVVNIFNVSGPGIASSSDQFILGVNSNDLIQSDLGASGDTIFYGNATQSLSNYGIFEGSRSDSRSRFLLTAGLLQSLGITAGELDMLSFYVWEKNSNGAYNNFRIGMSEISNSTLNGVGWLSTTEVYNGNVQTVAQQWNTFDFHTPFEWDGTSNIYVDICFNNSTAIGLDKIVMFDTGDGLDQMFAWSTNALNNCGSVTNYSYYYDRCPVLLLRQKSSTQAETVVGSFAKGRLKVGETANLFSQYDRIIASIKNTGSTSLECLDATVVTQGNGKANLPFASAEYTNKTIEIETSGNGTYELTLYFTDEELATWGSESLNLEFVKSTLPIASATANSTTFVPAAEVNNQIGANNVVAYTATFTGSGYFALTNGIPVTANVSGTFKNADALIDNFGSGILLHNSNGDQFIIKVDGNGDLVATLNNSLVAKSYLPTGDLCVITPTKGLLFRRTSNSITRINVDANGDIMKTNSVAMPIQYVSLPQGNFGIMEPSSGIVVQNIQNECWKIYVDANGNIATGQVPCQ